MKKVMLIALLATMGAASSAMAVETVSSSSYSEVTCSMEDHTCQKLILDMGRQEALNRVISGDNGKISVVLKQSIQIVRQQSDEVKNLTDAQIIELLAQQQ